MFLHFWTPKGPEAPFRPPEMWEHVKSVTKCMLHVVYIFTLHLFYIVSYFGECPILKVFNITMFGTSYYKSANTINMLIPLP